MVPISLALAVVEASQCSEARNPLRLQSRASPLATIENKQGLHADVYVPVSVFSTPQFMTHRPRWACS